MLIDELDFKAEKNLINPYENNQIAENANKKSEYLYIKLSKKIEIPTIPKNIKIVSEIEQYNDKQGKQVSSGGPIPIQNIWKRKVGKWIHVNRDYFANISARRKNYIHFLSSKFCFFNERFVLLTHKSCLNLSNCIHSNNNYD